MGWPVGRVLSPALADTGGRPSIYDDRCRPPPAVYPRTRAGRPRTCARPAPEGAGLLDLAPGGVYLASPVARRWWSLAPPFHPYRTGGAGWRSVFCGTVPRVAPGGCYPPPCPVEPGPSSATPRRYHAVARPAHPQDRIGSGSGSPPYLRHSSGTAPRQVLIGTMLSGASRGRTGERSASRPAGSPGRRRTSGRCRSRRRCRRAA